MEGGSAFQTPMEGSRSNSIGLGGLQMAPAGTADMNGAARTVDELPVQVRQLVFSIRRFYNAQSGADIDSISSLFAPDAVLDIPVTQMHGRDHIMTTWHFAKQFVDIDMLPKMVTIKMLDPKQAQVDIESELVISGRRRWWLPLSYVLPAVHMHGVVTVRLRGDDKVIRLTETFHNLPLRTLLPRLVVSPIGYMLGSALKVSEPVWGKLDML